MSNEPLKRPKRASGITPDTATSGNSKLELEPYLGLPVQATFSEVKDFIGFCRTLGAHKVQLFGLSVEFPAQSLIPHLKTSQLNPQPPEFIRPREFEGAHAYQDFINSQAAPFADHLSDEDRQRNRELAQMQARAEEDLSRDGD